MAVVIDYAWVRPGVTVLKEAGAVAVCRYFSWLPNGKCLTRSEADTLRAGGIDIVSNWEFFGDWANDYSGGRANGRIHAQEAQRQHLACGGPAGRPIYFSTDFDATGGQLPTVADYYRGVADVIGLDRTGAYGGYRTIKYLFDAGVIRWGWQTYAWSGGQWDSRAQLRQVRNSVKLAGVFDVDINETRQADYGQWKGEGMAGEADKAFATPYTGNETWVSPHSWMARAVERPLREVSSTLGALQTQMAALAARPAVSLTDEQVKAIAAQIVAHPETNLSETDLDAVGDVVRTVLHGAHFVAQDQTPATTEGRHETAG